MARAELLLQSERYEDAERELALALADEPENGYVFSLLGLVLDHLHQPHHALRCAQRGASLEPENDYAHYAMAVLLVNRGRTREALKSCQEALRLDPDDPSNHALAAHIYVRMHRWKDVLAYADSGLELDPADVALQNLRTQALSILGRRHEAHVTARESIHEDPEHPESHAHLGRVLLAKGETLEAQRHFREALRLDPQLEWAREGLLDCLRARFAPYRWLLSMHFFLARYPPGTRIAIGFIAITLTRMLGRAARQQPALLPIAIPVAIVVGFFFYFSWAGPTMLNMVIRFHPFGRYALSRQERAETTWSFVFLGHALVGAVLAATGRIEWVEGVFPGLISFFLICLSTVFVAEQVRKSMVLFLGLFGLVLCAAMMTGW